MNQSRQAIHHLKGLTEYYKMLGIVFRNSNFEKFKIGFSKKMMHFFNP